MICFVDWELSSLENQGLYRKVFFASSVKFTRLQMKKPLLFRKNSAELFAHSMTLAVSLFFYVLFVILKIRLKSRGKTVSKLTVLSYLTLKKILFLLSEKAMSSWIFKRFNENSLTDTHTIVDP